MKILHITNWHPNRENAYEAIWMRRHVEALADYAEQEVWHIEVRGGKPFKYHKYKDSYNCNHRVLDIPTSRWFIIEFLTTLLLWWALRFNIKRSKFDILNIHIAYPLLTYWNWYKKMIKMPVVITEHWSAYHLNFGMPKETTKLDKIKRIFHQAIPVFTVSKSLGDDIAKFANTEKLERYVIPNVVQTNIFNSRQAQFPSTPRFFMVSKWAYPKVPNIAIQAFASLLETYPAAELRIGGYGKLIPEMEDLAKTLGIEKNITFLGKLSAAEIVKEQNNASAFLHPSGYETFSVVCVEALCCGTPVVASRVGGIPEFIDDTNGILVKEQTEKSWAIALQQFMQQYHENTYNKQEISQHAALRFDAKAVGKLYYQQLKKQVDIFKK